jgi:uncharacterized protein (TIGR02145 family)
MKTNRFLSVAVSAGIGVLIACSSQQGNDDLIEVGGSSSSSKGIEEIWSSSSSAPTQGGDPKGSSSSITLPPSSSSSELPQWDKSSSSLGGSEPDPEPESSSSEHKLSSSSFSSSSSSEYLKDDQSSSSFFSSSSLEQSSSSSSNIIPPPPPLESSSSFELSSSSIASSSSSSQQSIIYGPSISYGGQTYNTVVIGTQVWMAENLNYNVSGSVCYDNDPANCAKYGRLYDWETALTVCPSGWHLPSDDEWTTLMYSVDFVTSGTKLKATSGWSDVRSCDGSWDNISGECLGNLTIKSGNGTDDYGFAALPSGGKSSGNYGYFTGVGTNCYWWTTTETSATSVYFRGLSGGTLGRGYSSKNVLYSVRCLQN